MNKPNLRDGNHEIVIVKEKNERILTPEQTKEYDAKHPNARKIPMNLGAESHDLPKMNYDLGGILSSIKSSTQNTPENIANANRIQKAADAIPEQSTSAPDLSQKNQQDLQWAFDKGGTVPAQESYTGRIMNRAKELYNQYKGDLSKYVSTVQEPMGGISANQQNVDQYKAAEQAERPKMQQPYAPSPSDRINPGAKYGDRPGEKRPDKVQLFDDSGVVQPEKDDEDKAAKDAALRQAETEVNAEERGRTPDQVQVDIGGAKAFPNPKGIKPQMDTDAPEFKPDYKMQGARMNTDNAPLKPAPMDTSNAAVEGPQPAPASTGVINVPRSSKMNYTPVAPEAKPEEVAAPDPMDIIRQDKMDAMKKGDNVALGNALINERHLPQYTGKGADKVAQGEMITPQDKKAYQALGKEKYQQTVNDLRDKMLHGATEEIRFQAEKDLAEYKEHTPWGGDESAHPGFVGKLGHVAARIGEGALTGYLGPAATAAFVPGSKEGLERQAAVAEQGVEQAQKTAMAPAEQKFKEAQAAREAEVPLDQQMIKQYDELEAAKASGDTARIAAANTRLDHLQSVKTAMLGDEEKRPVGDEGVVQHNKELNQMTQGMDPAKAKAFEDAFSVGPHDTHKVATKRLEDAKAVVALNQTEQDRALQRGIAEKNHEDNMGAREDARQDRLRGKFYTYRDAEGTHLVQGNQLPEDAKDELSIPNPQQFLAEARSSNIVQESLNKVYKDVEEHPEVFDNAAARAILTTTLEQIDRQSAGLLVAGTGGQIPLPSGLGDIINTQLQNKVLDKPTAEALKTYIADYKNMKDKAIIMQMDMQGGKIGRASQVALNAIINQIPNGSTPDSKRAMQQLENMQTQQNGLMGSYPDKYQDFTKLKPYEVGKKSEGAAAPPAGATDEVVVGGKVVGHVVLENGKKKYVKN